MTFMLGFISGVVVGMALVGLAAWAFWPRASDEDYSHVERL